jgi:hypothetical protein
MGIEARLVGQLGRPRVRVEKGSGSIPAWGKKKKGIKIP